MNDPMSNHKCRKIAEVPTMGKGRKMWLGKLTEPIEGHEGETHCVHITTPYKSVVFGMELGDFLAWAVFATIVHGKEINHRWLSLMAGRYRDAAEEER